MRCLYGLLLKYEAGIGDSEFACPPCSTEQKEGDEQYEYEKDDKE